MHVSPHAPEFTRSWLVRPELRVDFDWLKRQPDHADRKISVLLQHLDLAHYNRSLVNWKIDDAISKPRSSRGNEAQSTRKTEPPPVGSYSFETGSDDSLYRNFVLSPWIEPDDQDFGWRRMLWEAFYPRIRRENDPRPAAEIVVRFLRERVTITGHEPIGGRSYATPTSRRSNGARVTRPSEQRFTGTTRPRQSIPEIWSAGITDTAGFERIHTAALRAVGIATRLGANGQVEMWTGSQWERAPEPFIKAAPSSFRKAD